jgi:hypothetical protein
MELFVVFNGAAKAEMFPVPLELRPTAVFELVQEKTAPVGVLENAGMTTCSPVQNVSEETGFVNATGFTYTAI